MCVHRFVIHILYCPCQLGISRPRASPPASCPTRPQLKCDSCPAARADSTPSALQAPLQPFTGNTAPLWPLCCMPFAGNARQGEPRVRLPQSATVDSEWLLPGARPLCHLISRDYTFQFPSSRRQLVPLPVRGD